MIKIILIINCIIIKKNIIKKSKNWVIGIFCLLKFYSRKMLIIIIKCDEIKL